MNAEEAFNQIVPIIDSLSTKELTRLMHMLENYYNKRYCAEACPVELSTRDADAFLATFATIQGKFIDENDWWRDGHVADATIQVYAVTDNALLASGTTDQNGYYSVSWPFFRLEVRVVATPPASARCKRAQNVNQLTVNNVIEVVDFKDECKF